MDIKAYIKELKRSGKLKYILIILIVGITLVSLGARASKKSDEETRGEKETASLSYAEAQLEAKITKLCERVDGVSDVSVAVSLENACEYVLPSNGSEYAFSSDSDSVILQASQKISGIGIVCEGGGDSRIQKELISLISAAYGVGANKIFITEAQK